MKIFNNKARFILVYMLVLLCGASLAHAASFKNLKVTKIADGETDNQDKYKKYNAGYAEINSMSNEGKEYYMWIEKSTGTNVSNTKAFKKPCSSNLIYNRPVHITSGYRAHLNISTVLTTFASCKFSGYWTPNQY